MALLDSNYFIFGNQNCRTLGLRMAWFDGDYETSNDTGLNIDLVTSEMNLVRSKVNLYGGKPSDVLKFNFGIMKSDRTDMTRDESRIINNWLRGSNSYQRLYFEGETDHYFNAVCTELTDIVYAGLAGKKVEFTCDSIYCYTREVKKLIKVNGETSIKLYNSSDAGIYYPILKIHADSDYMTIANNSDGNSMALDFSQMDTKDIIIDSERCRVTDNTGKLVPAYKIGWDINDNIYWFRMVGGSNELHLTGDGTVEIQCEFPHKEGIL